MFPAKGLRDGAESSFWAILGAVRYIYIQPEEYVYTHNIQPVESLFHTNQQIRSRLNRITLSYVITRGKRSATSEATLPPSASTILYTTKALTVSCEGDVAWRRVEMGDISVFTFDM